MTTDEDPKAPSDTEREEPSDLLKAALERLKALSDRVGCASNAVLENFERRD